MAKNNHRAVIAGLRARLSPARRPPRARARCCRRSRPNLAAPLFRSTLIAPITLYSATMSQLGEARILAAEESLGVVFPPAYRQSRTNGCTGAGKHAWPASLGNYNSRPVILTDSRQIATPSEQKGAYMLSTSDEIMKQRRLALRNRSRDNWIMLISIIFSVFIAGMLVVSFGFGPHKAMIISFAGALVLGTVLSLIKRNATCPECGCSWDYAWGPDNPSKWRECPQCGLDISKTGSLQQ